MCHPRGPFLRALAGLGLCDEVGQRGEHLQRVPAGLQVPPGPVRPLHLRSKVRR